MSTSSPCFTLSATHFSLRSGATASAFITATRKPCRVRMSSIRPVMSRVPVWVTYTSTLRPSSRSAATRSMSAFSFGYSLSSDSGGTCTMTSPVLGSNTVSPLVQPSG